MRDELVLVIDWVYLNVEDAVKVFGWGIRREEKIPKEEASRLPLKNVLKNYS